LKGCIEKELLTFGRASLKIISFAVKIQNSFNDLTGGYIKGEGYPFYPSAIGEYKVRPYYAF
jgi:hypothetical protein